jgi:hypothetical protein
MSAKPVETAVELKSQAVQNSVRAQTSTLFGSVTSGRFQLELEAR